MEQRILSMLKKLINTVELTKVKSINHNTVVFEFAEKITLFIDSTSEGIDFSLTAMTDEAMQLIDEIEKSVEEDSK